VEVHRNIKQMFRWAEKRQPWRRLLIDGNPAELFEIAKVVDPEYDLSNIRSRVLNGDEIRMDTARPAAHRRDDDAGAWRDCCAGRHGAAAHRLRSAEPR